MLTTILIMIIGMLLFGGIIPSRLHHLTLQELISRVNVLLEIKKNNPHIKIYANELIMRCPAYSSSVEEPDYFDECGFEIFKYGELLCKEKFSYINDEEKLELERLIRSEIGEGGYRGFCHKYWLTKKNILKDRFNIEWKSPADLNPQIWFD